MDSKIKVVEKLSKNSKLPVQKPVRILFYDGACGLCTRSVRLLIKIDRHRLIQFAPLHGLTSAKKLPLSLREASNLSTVVYLKEDSGMHKLHTRSNAVCAILIEIGGVWRILGKLLHIVPIFLREKTYRLIAKYRNLLFPVGACQLLQQEHKERLLD